MFTTVGMRKQVSQLKMQGEMTGKRERGKKKRKRKGEKRKNGKRELCLGIKYRKDKREEKAERERKA